MATKASLGRKATLSFVVSGSSITTVFSAVRNWSVRVDREIIEATNNDSSGWRELVMPSTGTASAAVSQHNDAGQRTVVFSAEAVYDINPLGPLGSSARSQANDRRQIMRNLIDGTALTSLNLWLGRDPTNPLASTSWGNITISSTIKGYVESVEVGGSYDTPVLYNLTIRGNGRATI